MGIKVVNDKRSHSGRMLNFSELVRIKDGACHVHFKANRRTLKKGKGRLQSLSSKETESLAVLPVSLIYWLDSNHLYWRNDVLASGKRSWLASHSAQLKTQHISGHLHWDHLNGRANLSMVLLGILVCGFMGLSPGAYPVSTGTACAWGHAKWGITS